MGEIISATTRFTATGGRSAEFLEKANILLDQARQYRRAGDLSLALEFGYRSSLRTAGAIIAASPVSKRKRKPRGAWNQLALVDGAAADWATELSAFSRIRSRASSGLEVNLSEEYIDGFLSRVGAFLDEGERGAGWLPSAA
ncbi:SAV_6107 family HEPN domain-containing protein [Corynebacterium pacaense]|uniref:SAV_6107 family HEPN domain-containing protein n=1 Tax=Corynebacterium pacaense TaxID=1816684 RepID=UPI0009BC1769|nr:SAV_6107 family HEPN domain-containing protein [Corynebacterium pacaense]